MGKTKTNVTVISKISDRKVGQRAALVVIHGADLGRKYDLAPKMVVGRAATSDIQVDQDSVSRKHAQIEVDGDAVYVSDLKSTNGTFINDDAVEGRVPLRNGDFLKVGRTIFKFIAGGNIEASYHDEIYRLTTMDGLTQICNRRFFEETLEREFSRCRRYGRPLSLIMMDLDLFKRVNDTHGHLAGDSVLKHVAAILKPKFRREDTFARYGGEEFAVLLPELKLPEATAAAEKARKLVEESPCKWEGESIRVTLSIGVASLEESMQEGDELVKAADEMLYRAKEHGRNRVESTGPA